MSETAPQVDTEALKNQVAAIGTDPYRWTYGGKVITEDVIVKKQGAGRGLWLYDDLARDAKVATCLQKRRDALIGREWEILPPDDSAIAAQAAELCTRALRSIDFNAVCEKLLDALLKGISIMEVVWAVRGNELLPAHLYHRDARRFVFRLSPGDMAASLPQLKLLTKSNPTAGDDVPMMKFIIHRHGGLYEDPWGLGLGNRLFWPVFFKRQGVGFWLSALEKFGQPTAVGKYPPGTQLEQIDNLLAAAGALASEAAVAIPEGMALELLEAKRGGTFDSYESLARYMDEDIAQVILGETLTSGAGQGGTGSRSLGQVHNEVRLEITKADSEKLSDTLAAQLMRWIVDLNLPAYAATGLDYPALAWDVSEPQDLMQTSQRDVNILALGYRPTEDYIRLTYGEGWEKAPEPAPPTLPAPGAPSPRGTMAPDLAALFAEAKAATRAGTLPAADDPRDAADQLTDQIDAVAAGAQDALIDAVRGVIEHADSLDQARLMLVKLLPEMPVAQLARLLGQAMTVAALTGRADLQDGV